MPEFIKSKKKLFFRLTIMVVLALALAGAQARMLKVRAQVLPIKVNVGELNYGLVFPGEKLEKNFTVTYNNDVDEPVTYSLVQKIKPLPGAVVPVGYSGTISQYCQVNPTDYSRCYKNLCDYITKISKEGEGDTESGAEVSLADLTDNWIVNLTVPAIFGQVAQDNTGGIVSQAGDYGCDISFEVKE